MSDQNIAMSELKIALAELRQQIKEDNAHDISTAVYDLETRLLEEFRKWATPSTARSKVQGIQILGLEGRLSLIEDRLNDLETKS